MLVRIGLLLFLALLFLNDIGRKTLVDDTFDAGGSKLLNLPIVNEKTGTVLVESSKKTKDKD